VTTLVAGLVGAAACDDHRTSRDAGSGVSAGTGAPGQDADAALVDHVRSELTDVLAVVTAAGSASASLRARLRPFRELHRAHLAVLSDAHGTGASPTSTPAPTARQDGRSAPAAALHQVLQRERLTKARLADAAVSARSGTLARLLASMSAAVAQRVAVTDATTGAGTPGATP
jgi:hypothetical protein